MSAKIKKNNVKISVKYTVSSVAAYIYVIFMMGLFPLFYRNNYINIMESKWGFFMISTFVAAGVALVGWIVVTAIHFQDVKPSSYKEVLKKISTTDWCMLILMITVLISWLGCEQKSDAFSGETGKMAGVFFYIVLFVAYFLVSRFLKYDQWILYIYICANLIVFGLAILNHFMIDPLGMYTNLMESNYWMFITTMGNINVLAGYLCIFVPVTMVLFCYCTSRRSMIIYGVFMAVSFMGLVAANGDAGLIGIGCAFVFLLWFCFESYERLMRYFLMAAIFFTGSAVIGILDSAYADSVKEPLETLPSLVAKSAFNRVAIVLFFALALLMYVLDKKNAKDTLLKLIRNIVYIIFGIGVAAGLGIFIYLSTAGSDIELGAWATYLRFSDAWGSSRGFTWKRVLNIYGAHFNVFQKLFGCGPDLLGIYLHEYFNDEIFAQMGAYLVDAHNETLQSLGTLGIFGVIGYMGAQLTAAVRYTKMHKEDPFLLAVATGIVAYLTQGMMSSPQTFSTPMLIIAIAIGESIIRNSQSE